MGVIMYNGIQYTGAGGGGSDVTPNPEGSATDILKKLEIEDTIYGISNTIELTQAEYDDLPSSKLTDNILYIIKDAAGASGGNNKTLSGTVAPAAALGDNGDEYIQYHLSSNTPVIDAKYTKVRGQWITYQDDSTIVVPVAPAYSPGDHISINQSNEISATYSAFQGTDGTDPGSSGLVPAPAATDEDKYLKSDGTWATVAAGGGNVEDVYVNGTSVLDSNKIAQVKSYMELTESQYNALPASKLSDDVLYCISDIDYEDRNYFNPIIYSTEEREVGVWTNNKPLYQKTKLFSSVSQGEAWYEIDVNNASKVIKVEVTGIRTEDGFQLCNNIVFPSWSEGNIGINFIDVTSTKIKLSIANGYYPLSDVYITCYYTKSTDTPGSGKYNTLGVPAVHYSTDEQVIGTWIDNKPLYQKTMYFGAISSGANYQLIMDIGVNIVDTVIDMFANAKVSSGAWVVLPYPLPNADYAAYLDGYNKSTDKLTIKTGSARSFVEGYITIQYTKTTD